MKTLKKRTILVRGLTCGDCEIKLESALGAFRGVKAVEVNPQRGEVWVEHDLGLVTLSEIEKEISNQGFELGVGMFDRIRRGWVHFTEENEKGNLETVPTSCCSNPKDILEKAGK
ncbi:cation transporter [candidate division KSB1 bacterium]|nr:cation transporter [candidate division KSB1 bacterium]